MSFFAQNFGFFFLVWKTNSLPLWKSLSFLPQNNKISNFLFKVDDGTKFSGKFGQFSDIWQNFLKKIFSLFCAKFYSETNPIYRIKKCYVVFELCRFECTPVEIFLYVPGQTPATQHRTDKNYKTNAQKRFLHTYGNTVYKKFFDKNSIRYLASYI